MSHKAKNNTNKNLEDTNAVDVLWSAFQRLSAAILCLILSPILVASYLAIRFTSQGGAIYSQVRVGHNGKRFMLYKFRSMYLANDPKFVQPDFTKSDREGVCIKLKRDPRITAVGAFIRKYSIDELPQIFNVIKGDMLLIGPRPALPLEVDQYDVFALKRLEVVPGMTGLWQVSGRADTTFQEQISLDIKYIETKSFLTDMKISMMTVPAVLMAKGAY